MVVADLVWDKAERVAGSIRQAGGTPSGSRPTAASPLPGFDQALLKREGLLRLKVRDKALRRDEWR